MSTGRLQNIAHFLLLNSEDQKNSGFKGQLPVLYFFFTYAYKHTKKHYADFAFELLQENISQISAKTQCSKSTVHETIEMGWAIMQFVKIGFFESEGLDETLQAFDKIAISEVQRLSRGASHTINSERLVLCALYFMDRSDFTQENGQCEIIIREHLLIIFFEIANGIKGWDTTEVGTKLFLSFLLKNSREHALVGHFALQVLQELDMDFLSIEQYDKELELDVMRYLCHYGNDNYTENGAKKLKGLLTGITERLIQQLYETESEDAPHVMQKVIVYSCILLSPDERRAKLFLAYAVHKLLRSHEI